MEKFSRVLTVAIAAISIAFLGFAGVVSFGGPNWEAEARAMEGYTFTQAPGDPPIWSATRAEGREELSTKSALLPEVLAAAIQDRTTRAREERDRLAAELPAVEQQANRLKSEQQADVPALDRHFQIQMQRLNATHQAAEAASKQQETLAVEVGKIEDQLDSRRQDVFRLELQHRLLEADIRQIDQNVSQAEEQIRLLEDELDKSRRRQSDLDAQGLPPAG